MWQFYYTSTMGSNSQGKQKWFYLWWGLSFAQSLAELLAHLMLQSQECHLSEASQWLFLDPLTHPFSSWAALFILINLDNLLSFNTLNSYSDLRSITYIWTPSWNFGPNASPCRTVQPWHLLWGHLTAYLFNSASMILTAKFVSFLKGLDPLC